MTPHCAAQVQHHEQGGKAVPLGREPLCPMFSWVKARTHYDILVPDGARCCDPAHHITSGPKPYDLGGRKLTT